MALLAVGLGTAGLYALWVLWVPLLPGNLYLPLLDLGKITGYTWPSAVFYLALVGGLYLLYAVGYVAVRRGLARQRAVLLFAALFCAELLLVYPATAVDVFAYMADGRLLVVHDVNPFIVAPNHYPGDAIVPYLAYPGEPSQYGPVWVLLSGLLALLSGGHLLPEMLLYKAVGATAQLGGAGLVYAASRQLGASTRLASASSYLFAWNPLLLWEMVGNAHNDGWMMLAALAAIWCLAGSHADRGVRVGAQAAGAWMLVLPALAVGALVKLPVASIAPLLFVWLWTRRRRIALEGAVLALALAAVIYRPFWDGLDTLTALRRTGLFTASLGSVLRMGLEPSLGLDLASAIARGTSLALFAIVILVCLWRVRCAATATQVVRLAYVTLLAAALLGTTWFQAWYLVWPLALGAVLADGQRHLEVALLSLGGLLQYLVFIYLWVIGVFHGTDSLPLQVAAYLAIIGPLLLGLAWRALRRAPGMRPCVP